MGCCTQSFAILYPRTVFNKWPTNSQWAKTSIPQSFGYSIISTAAAFGAISRGSNINTYNTPNAAPTGAPFASFPARHRQERTRCPNASNGSPNPHAVPQGRPYGHHQWRRIEHMAVNPTMVQDKLRQAPWFIPSRLMPPTMPANSTKWQRPGKGRSGGSLLILTTATRQLECAWTEHCAKSWATCGGLIYSTASANV